MPNAQRILAAALIASALAVSPPSDVSAQPAPVPHAVVTAQDPPEAARGLFAAPLSAGGRDIEVPGATWLQLRFSDTRLREGERLVVSSPGGETQSFTGAQLGEWGGLTAVFNGSRLNVRVEGSTAQASDIRLSEVIVGLPAQGGQVRESTLPAPLRDFLGPQAQRFMMRSQAENPVAFRPESLCGNDDRVASNNPLVGRIMPVGCTGWLISRDRVLTAGHCRGAMTVLQFNVPRSLPDGTPVAPGVRDQYRINAASVVGRNTGIGDDWALFTVAANTQTGLMPSQAQGGVFRLSRTDRPATIRITGYGLDDGADSQTQQTNAGANLDPITDAAGRVQLRYRADTQGGNSGGPVINEANPGTSIGIHTNAGCTPTGGENTGTGLGNGHLWDALTSTVLSWSSAGPIPGRVCTQISEAADPHTWSDNYLCADRDHGFRWSSAGPIPGMTCTAITESADPHTWGDNFLCLPPAAEIAIAWSSAGPVPGFSQCVQLREPADPHTWDDNFLCYRSASPLASVLAWSFAGPMPGRVCTQISEAADPHTWSDNYLCADRDYGLRWSSAGPIPGMTCTAITEAADPHTWGDNFLCLPPGADLVLAWSSAGPAPGFSDCVQLREPADPHTWDDNFLCYRRP